MPPKQTTPQTHQTQPKQMDPSIAFSKAYWKKLQEMVHQVDELKMGGYKMGVLGEDELKKLRRCRDCHVRIRVRKNKEKKEGEKDRNKDGEKCEDQGDENKDDAESESGDVDQIDQLAKLDIQDETLGVSAKGDDKHIQEGVQVTVSEVKTPIETNGKDTTDETKDGKKDGQKKKKKKKTAVCQFHTGRVVDKHFTCCRKHVSELGCVELAKHTAIEYAPGELEQEWALYETPTKAKSPRKAVALDCEMGVNEAGESELIRVSAVDYFTGEVLLDSLVSPSVPMLHYNTRYSGVTRAMMFRAERRKQCIAGRDRAREQLWRYVGRETIVVMHGGQNDMLSLRWIHGRVIDTYLVEGSREQPQPGRSLKHLTEVHLGEKIQQGKGGHDSIEDAMACRGLCHW
ncbi:hypothetical protein MW887_008906 [Aspergillus wentii]|nr:hypothetical protein MW887_008906 [Aspergillus wentii]